MSMSRRLIPEAARASALALALFGCAHPMAEGPRGPATGIPAPQRTAIVSELAQARFYALIINGDMEERHLQNVERAVEALRANSLDKDSIIVSSANLRNATREKLEIIVSGMSGWLGPADGLIVYVTGHGTPEGFVLQDRSILKHDDFVSMMRPFRDKKTILVFDTCYSGALPEKLVGAGFNAVAMAPVAEGEESQCHLFSPYLWSAVRSGMDSNNDGKTTFEEVFRSAMEVYNTKRKAAGMEPVFGVFDRPLPELHDLSEIRKGNAIVELSASWCGPCKMQRRELNTFRSLMDGEVKVFTVDVESTQLLPALQRAAGRDILGGVPRLLYFRDGAFVDMGLGLTETPALIGMAGKAFGLGKGGNPVLVGKLKQNLSSRDMQLRFGSLSALLAMGVCDAEVAQGFLSAISRSEPREAAALLVEVAELPGYKSLLERIGSGGERKISAVMDDAFRGEARLIVSYIRGPEPVAAYARNMLLGTALLLRRQEDGMGVLGDNVPMFSLRLAGSLNILREEARALALERLQTSTDYQFYWATLSGFLGYAEAVPRLTALAAEGRDIEVRMASIFALGNIAEPSSLDTVKGFAKSRDAKIRRSAILALSRFYVTHESSIPSQDGTITISKRVPAAFDTIKAAMKDAHPSVRLASALAMGDIGTDEALKAVVSLRRDPVQQVRLGVLSALSSIRSEEALSYIGDMAKTDKDAGLRSDAEGVARELRK